MNKNEITQLAKTFSTACKDAVEKGKVKTYTTPIVLAAMTALLGVGPKAGPWLKV